MQRKRLRWILLIAACLMILLGTAQVHAAKKNMKNSAKGITWKFKTNKKYRYYSYWGGVGMIAQDFKVTKWKDEWSGNKGMRRLSFRITFIRKKKPTAKQLVKAATYFHVKHPELDNTSPGCYYAVVDFDTGMSLEDPQNPYGVIVSNDGWHTSSGTTYKTPGYSIVLKNVYVDVSIEYPYTYKGLCIGIGGMTKVNSTQNDKLFWDGVFPFWMSDSLWSVKKKQIARFGTWSYKN